MDVLNSLSSKSLDKNYRYQKLYRNLYNQEFYLIAYSKIYANEGNMTKGTDDKTIDGMSLDRIEKIINSLKDESYQPKPAKRVYIPKKNGSKRPLGIPSFDDKLLQEVVRMLLESIFEKSFSDKSHGFRPQRSCHTALNQVQKDFIGVRWFIEGDIKGFFDEIDHHILIKLLRKRIKDEKFIRLIWKFLKAGYIENWVYHKTYSGTPQGGIISPILSNIYLNELDEYMEEKISMFEKGKSRQRTKEARSIEWKLGKARKQLNEKWDELTEDEKKIHFQEIKRLELEQTKMHRTDPMDENFKRLRYVRYADDFLIGVIGSKEDCVKLKNELSKFLMNHLKLTLSQEKTLITNSSKFARFLSYDITMLRSSNVKTCADGAKRRVWNMKPMLYVPKEKWVNNLLEKKALRIDSKTQEWKSHHRPELIRISDLEILMIYNAEIRGLYNYYKLAENASVIQKYKYIMEYSMYKTLANKFKLSVPKIINKYNINGEFGIKVKRKDGKEKIHFLYNKGFKKIKVISSESKLDEIFEFQKLAGKTSLIQRLEAEKCEWCGKKEQLEIHHVRKLKDLKGKAHWEKIMIARKRKTMALCKECHINLHKGKLD